MTGLRCAIYTRKSSEEGLEQDFNSLDAQREACLAYVRSQKGEGWSALPTHYDDGGWSGGNMDRPGLKRLLADIDAKLVDVVVVYKVDRLTRSLADFARIVDTFDRNGVSFVSVTQAFNTTSSMGRLTLNVLLSFAQFEREVTGERIRDKIAASKAKGMWMGGVVPLGYVAKERALAIDPEEAKLVRMIFVRYLQVGSVHVLMSQLAAEGVRSKRWTTRKGEKRGGTAFSRGPLFHLLRNRIYLGEIVHHDKSYPGQHEAIVDQATFDAVQAMLDGNVRRRRTAATEASPLAGILFDGTGVRMTPTASRGRSRKYRYYVSAQQRVGGSIAPANRIPAPAIEGLVLDRLRLWSGMPHSEWSHLLPHIKRIEAHSGALVILLDPPSHTPWRDRIAPADTITDEAGGLVRVSINASVKTKPGRASVIVGERSARSRPNPSLISALRRSHRVLADHGIIHAARDTRFENARAPDDPWLRNLVRMAFLAPDIQHAILTGRQPAGLALFELMASNVPLDWQAQREALGFQ